MKKIIRLLAMMILCICVFTGCDNNEGPFSYRMEKGVKVLYSGDKPAKGMVKNEFTNFDGVTTTVAEIYYDKGLPAGDFTLYSLDGDPVVEAEGKWKNGLFIGKINEPYVWGESAGTFSINKTFLMDYEGACLYEDEQSFAYRTLYDGHVHTKYEEVTKVDGEADGTYQRFYVSGFPLVEATYNKGNLNGKYIEYYRNGKTKLEQNAKNGELDGFYGEYFQNGAPKFTATYKAGKYHGVVTNYDGNRNKVSEYTYADGVKEGPCMDHDKLKIRFEGNYHNDKKHGPYKKFLRDEVLEQGQYKDGELDGKMIAYYMGTGYRLYQEREYKNGVLDGTTTVYNKGNKVETMDYKNGVIDGKHILYYSDGKPKVVKEVKDNEYNGVCTLYFDNGKVQMTGTYKDGRPHGTFKEYNKRGQLIAQKKYENGQQIN